MPKCRFFTLTQALAFITLILLLLTGCSNQNISQEQKNKSNGSDSGGKFIKVLVEGGSPAYSAATNTAEEFRIKTGYEIKIDAVPYISVLKELRTGILSGKSQYDAATIDVLWLPELYEGLLPIAEIVTEEMKADLLPGVLQGGSINGEIYGMPSWTNCKILLYRRDLFEDSMEKTGFKRLYGYDLKPPGTWKEYRDAAKFFTRDTNNDGQSDVFGTGIFGANKGDSVSSWLDASMQAGAKPLVFDGDGSPVINQKPYVEALQFLADILNKDKSAPPGALEMASEETTKMFWNGKLAMMLAWGHFYIQSEDTSKSKVAGKVGTAPMISGAAGIGSTPGPWYQVIPKTTKKADVAREYLLFHYNKNTIYMDTLGVAARKSVFEEYGRKKGFEHLHSVADSLAGTMTQNRPATAMWPQIEAEALTPAVRQALSGEKTPQAALDIAVQQIKSLMEKK